VTIPAALRRKYGLKGGSRLALKTTPTGGFIMKPLTKRR
jgi:bifunctional DNA-binding transcriptional regulator/antitoxin component of YhaV-PrlF toxin-antitoxin module